MATRHGPERPGGQGLDPNQEESGNRAILALLTDPGAAEHTDLVITHRADAYEVWARRGMVRFERQSADGRQTFRVVEQLGENPIADQRHDRVATCGAELEAAANSGRPTDDPNRAFIEPHQLSYPHAYERIAQLFDSPYAPDLIVSPKCYAFGLQPGQHGALDVVQSRAPLAFAGPGMLKVSTADIEDVDRWRRAARACARQLGVTCSTSVSFDGSRPDRHLRFFVRDPFGKLVNLLVHE